VKLAAQTVFFSGHYPISTKAETPYCQCNAADRPPLIPPTFTFIYTIQGIPHVCIFERHTMHLKSDQLVDFTDYIIYNRSCELN